MSDMDNLYTFDCLGFQPKMDGTVECYVIQATSTKSGESIKIKMTPAEIVSHRKFKISLLNKCIFYVATKSEHEKTISQMFKKKLQKI